MTALRAVPEPVGVVALTPREQRVLEMIADGHLVLTIGHELGYSKRTVENIVWLVLSKLGAHTRAQAVHEAHRRGLLNAQELSEANRLFIDAMRRHIETLQHQVAKLEAQKADALQALLREG